MFRRKTKKYITFTVPIEKRVTRIDKNVEETTKYMSYILQFIDTAKSMTNSLSNLVKNLSKAFGNCDKKYET